MPPKRRISKSTREAILEKALKHFNERGIEYVGLRELADTLDIHVGNITYYFPTKDDLVNQLAINLSTLNSEVLQNMKKLDMQSFLGTIERIFANQAKYRCLMLSIVHIMEQNRVISARHKQTQQQRNEVLNENLITLSKNGLLKFKNANDAMFLASTISLISRFWISESTISYKQQEIKSQIKHTVSTIAHLLLPYATEKSKETIEAFVVDG